MIFQITNNNINKIKINFIRQKQKITCFTALYFNKNLNVV
jgi:hypothetical protein